MSFPFSTNLARAARRACPGALLAAVPLALGIGLTACAEGGGRSAAASEPMAQRPAFHGDRAFELLEQQVALGPRVPGTAAHQAQLRWMRDFLSTRADTLVEQAFSHTTAAGEALELTNLLARFRPDAERRILLLAHWDSRPTADRDPVPANRVLPVPGANDGASGVAVLLELAELFRTQPPPVGVDLLFTDGEDYGPGDDDMFLGARHFAATLPADYRPRFGILLDMVGDRDPRFPIEGYSHMDAPHVARRVWDVARQLGYADVFPLEVGVAIEDDHVPLNRAGIPTINIIDFDYPYWHTVDDVPANTSAETLRIVGEVVAEVVYRGG